MLHSIYEEIFNDFFSFFFFFTCAMDFAERGGAALCLIFTLDKSDGLLNFSLIL